MGRLIDIDEARKEYSNLMDLTMSDTTLLHTLYGVLDDAPTVEAIPKDQYEARLKADMVAMLTEVQLEIEELDSRAGYDGNGMPTFSTDYIRKKKVNELIQQKIDKLKEAD